jgi:polysaccharide export outer membrane protein
VQAAQPLQARPPSASALQRSRVVYDAYILGPGDSLQVELLDIPELNGTFSIGPDGTMYLPRLRALYVEGLTVEELRYFLTQQFKTYVKNPQLYVRPVGYRPIRIYVGGEVRRPGYYTLRGLEVLADEGQDSNQQVAQSLKPTEPTSGLQPPRTSNSDAPALGSSAESNKQAFPTVFDAIRAAQGISPFSDLAAVQVTRKQPLSAGGGRIRTNLNFLSLITEGDESQNIRLFDGDVVSVGKSPVVLRDQLIRAGRTNLSPQFINVFVTGRVNTPGAITLQQGSSLNQAISVAGGVKLLKGKVEFLRFLSDGKTDRRTFSYSANAPSDSYTNPILAAGDIIRVNDSALSAGVGALNEVATPLLGIYSIYALSNGAFR